MVTAKMVTVMR